MYHTVTIVLVEVFQVPDGSRGVEDTPDVDSSRGRGRRTLDPWSLRPGKQR